MLAAEFGCDTIPTTHPDHSLFSTERPSQNKRFQLIFCDGQVPRTHKRSSHREIFEATRLTASQLIIALNRIMPGGTLIMLLHKPESWITLKLHFQFNKFAEIQLFKPVKKHAIRSSFYLIAKNVRPQDEAAKAAVEEWKKTWFRATFGGEDGTGGQGGNVDLDLVSQVLDEFGRRLIELANPIWEIQAKALTKKDFTK